MQNKPKVKIGKMNITSYITMAYEKKYNWTLGKRGKNKPKQTQSQNRQNVYNFFYNNELRTKNYERCRQKQSQTNPNKPKVKIGKMNVTSFITMNYEQRTMNYEKNKPKQTQFPQRDTQYAIRDTKYKPKQTQIKLEAQRKSLRVSLPEPSNRGQIKLNLKNLSQKPALSHAEGKKVE